MRALAVLSDSATFFFFCPSRCRLLTAPARGGFGQRGRVRAAGKGRARKKLK